MKYEISLSTKLKIIMILEKLLNLDCAKYIYKIVYQDTILSTINDEYNRLLSYNLKDHFVHFNTMFMDNFANFMPISKDKLVWSIKQTKFNKEHPNKVMRHKLLNDIKCIGGVSRECMSDTYRYMVSNDVYDYFESIENDINQNTERKHEPNNIPFISKIRFLNNSTYIGKDMLHNELNEYIESYNNLNIVYTVLTYSSILFNF